MSKTKTSGEQNLTSSRLTSISGNDAQNQSVITQQPIAKSRFNLNQSTISAYKKERKLSFMQLETDQQIIMEKLIRQDMKMQGKLKQKMSLEEDETCLFASDIYKKYEGLWKNRETSQLTTKKLFDIQIENVNKIKLLNEHPMTGYNLYRVTYGEKDVKDFAIGIVDSPSWFASSLWVMLVNSGHELIMKKGLETETEGMILKKSQFLKNWEMRYVSISKNGLFSSVKKGEAATVKIKETSQLWSRFQVFVHGQVKYVVIKVWHMMFKCEFAVPLQDVMRWARAFSTLVR